jgi:hypothetical protein
MLEIKIQILMFQELPRHKNFKWKDFNYTDFIYFIFEIKIQTQILFPNWAKVFGLVNKGKAFIHSASS